MIFEILYNGFIITANLLVADALPYKGQKTRNSRDESTVTERSGIYH
ncbi:hypothetical protein PENANT_c193G10610, partial [Penicillium antarcticum]